jgi:hypothetical protein
MTDELQQERKALAAEIEHLRTERDRLRAVGMAGDSNAELLRQVKSEREHVRSERDRISTTDQRENDLGRASRSDVRQAVDTALERQRIASHTEDQDAHLAAINGSIEKSARALEDLAAQLKAIEAARHDELLVADKLAAALETQVQGGLTRRRLYISVAAIVASPLVTLLILLVKG